VEFFFSNSKTFFRKVQFSFSSLKTVDPLAFVEPSFCPINLSVAIADVSFVAAFIGCARGPDELTVSPLHIVAVVPLVFVGIAHSLLPESLALPATVEKVALEVASVEPVVAALSRGLPVLVVSSIHISVVKLFDSLPVSERFLKFSFVD
jgi:hypothetical protein